MRRFLSSSVADTARREEVVCEEPLLTVDRQLGVNIAHPAGKVGSSSSILLPSAAYPPAARENDLQAALLPRTHRHERHSLSSGDGPQSSDQGAYCSLACNTSPSTIAQVHLQYLGHPIANDPIYCRAIWGADEGKGGLYEFTEDVLEDKLAKLELKSGLDLGISSDILLSPTLYEALKHLRSERDHKTSVVHDAPNLHALAAGDLTALDDLDDYRVEDSETGPYCRACGQPLLPDPRPEQLYIWLKAVRYSSSAWDFSSSSLPPWAQDTWDGEIVQAVLDID